MNTNDFLNLTKNSAKVTPSMHKAVYSILPVGRGLIVTVRQDRLKPINERLILLEVISTRYYFAASIESTVQHIQLTTSAY
jgi:hypothetical protein